MARAFSNRMSNGWKVRGVTLAILACLPAFSSCVTSRSRAEFRTEKIEPILRDLQSERVTRVTIFSAPRGMTTFVNVTPEGLIQFCAHPVQKDLAGALRLELLQAVAGTQGREAGGQPDLRWGIHFLGANDECLHKVYLDGRGTRAVVDGATAKVNRRLVHWLERNFMGQ